MPKYYKKPKGTNAHQHVAGEDWSQAESWVQDLIAAGRLVLEGATVTVVLHATVPPYPVTPTEWITEANGLVEVLTDAEFADTYDKNTAFTG